jgi:hypothetical protein
MACWLPGEVAKNDAETIDVSPVWLFREAQNSGAGQKALTAVVTPKLVMLIKWEALDGWEWESISPGSSVLPWAS